MAHTRIRLTPLPFFECVGQVTGHGAGVNTKYNGQDLEVDPNGAVYLAGGYQNGGLTVGGGVSLASSPGFNSDGFLARVWLVRTVVTHGGGVFVRSCRAFI